ncbi:SGNH/GDSL hydrolase family protein [Actinomadura alba]
MTLAACSISNAASDDRPTPRPSTPARTSVVMFLGDSYTAGGRESPPARTYAADTARLLRWQVIVGGRGGTGFATPGSKREPFAALFERQLSWRPPPDMLIVSGGHNDRNRPPAQVGTAARDLLFRVKARWPGTHLVLLGPMWGTGTPEPSVLRIRDALEGVAHEVGIPFIDPLREQWITGDLRDGTGNAPHYILRDRVHPTPAGHRYIATRLAADLERLDLAHPVRRP